MQHRGSKILEAELTWLFCESAGELGLRGMPLEPAIGGDNDGPTDRAVEAASKHRRVTSALHALPHEHQRALRLAHTPMPPALHPRIAKLGELAGVMLGADEAAPAWIFMALGIVVQRGKHHQERTTVAETFLAEVKVTAHRSVATAVTMYREERRAQAATERTLRQRRHEERMRALRAA